MTKFFFVVAALSLYCLKHSGLICCTCWDALRLFSFCVCYQCLWALVCLQVSSHGCPMVHKFLDQRRRVNAFTVYWTTYRHSESQNGLSPSIPWFKQRFPKLWSTLQYTHHNQGTSVKGFFEMLLLINKLRLLGSSCSLIRTVNIKQGQYCPHLFDVCGAAHKYPLCADWSWPFPTAWIKHEGLGRNSLQWKAVEVNVELPHPQTQQYPVSVLRPDFSFELNGGVMCVPGHCRILSGGWWAGFCGVRFWHSVRVLQSRVKHVHRSSPRKRKKSVWLMYVDSKVSCHFEGWTRQLI